MEIYLVFFGERLHVARQRLDQCEVWVAVNEPLRFGEGAEELRLARRKLDRLLQDLSRFLDPTERVQHGAAAVVCIGKIGLDRQRPVIAGEPSR